MQIPLYKTYSDESDVQAVAEVIRCGTHWAEGPNIDLFEARLCEYLGVPGVLVCNSGTSALHMAMFACGVKHFHEVIVPSYTFIATANAVRFVGATPVFADIEESTCGLDPADVERRITSKTRAIVAVHYAGQPCRIKDLRRIADKRRLMLIEDACEALGARVDGHAVGTFGDCGVLSFCANKIISTGEGGALVTRDKYIYDQARLVRSHGREAGGLNSSDPERYIALGYNYRMSDLAAALGVSQLGKINFLIERRRQAAAWYQQRNVGAIKPGSVYQLHTTRFPANKRDAVLRHLQESGIGCKVYFRPVHLTEYYRKHAWVPQSLPVTERVSSEVLSLPMFPGVTEQEVDHICQKIQEVA